MIAFLDKYVCVEVFAEDEPDSFKKYDVDLMPTLMFISTKGEEIGRFTGFKNPQEFIKALGECANSRGNIRKGEELLSKNSESAEGLYLNALGCLYQNDKTARIFENLDKLVALEPEKDNKIYICKGLMMLSENVSLRPGRVAPKNIEEAEKEFMEPLLKIVELDPENVSGVTGHALYKLGVASVRNPEKKKEYFDKLKKLDPDDNYGYGDDIGFALALAPFYKKDYKKTIENLESFLAKHKNSKLAPKGLFQMANCYYRLKEKDKCIEALEKLLQEYPDSKESKSAESLLKRLKK